MVPVELSMEGAPKDAQPWVKTVNGIDPRQRGAYACKGDFSRRCQAHKEGAFLLLGVSSSGKGTAVNRYYVSVRVQEAGQFAARHGL
jgi:hypothetical protein